MKWMASSDDHEVLASVDGIDDGRGLAAGTQRRVPKSLAGFKVDRANQIVSGSGDEDRPASSDDRAAVVWRSDIDGKMRIKTERPIAPGGSRRTIPQGPLLSAASDP